MITGATIGFFPRVGLSRKCNGSGGELMETEKQKVNKEEK